MPGSNLIQSPSPFAKISQRNVLRVPKTLLRLAPFQTRHPTMVKVSMFGVSSLQTTLQLSVARRNWHQMWLWSIPPFKIIKESRWKTKPSRKSMTMMPLWEWEDKSIGKSDLGWVPYSLWDWLCKSSKTHSPSRGFFSFTLCFSE